MKNKLLLKIFTLLLVTVIFLSTISMAAYSDVTMQVVSEPLCHIDLTEHSYFEKSLVSKDLANKEITIQLKVVNDEEPDMPTGDIVLLIDNSDSMDDQINGKTRLQLIKDSAKTLATDLLSDSEDIRIAVASFSSVPSQDAETDEGTEKDAASILNLSSDMSEISSAIDSIPAKGSVEDGTDHPRTDLDAGLNIANTLFSEDDLKEKYLVVLTDGVPNLALGVAKEYYSDNVITKTTETLESLESDNVNIITMLVKTEAPNEIPGYGHTDKTYGEIAQKIFGTPESPTVGNFYYVTDSEVEKTITEDIYNDLKPRYKTLTNIKITDYFPQEIIDNFDFSYVSEATHGDISASVNPTDNSIVWNIPELGPEETATVEYKLKLKENFDTSILDKVLDTNDGVDIEYTDFDGENQTKHSDDTPQIKLTMPQPTLLPAAGTKIVITTFLIAFGIISLFTIRYFVLRNKLQ